MTTMSDERPTSRIRGLAWWPFSRRGVLPAPILRSLTLKLTLAFLGIGPIGTLLVAFSWPR